MGNPHRTKTKTTTAPKNIINANAGKTSSENTAPKNAMDYFERKLDDKRRLTIPTELRNEFSSGVVITRGFDRYLHMYSVQTWNEQMEPALTGQILDRAIADLNVTFRTGKTVNELDDKQGRVVIEQHLLDYAGIDRDLVAVRAGAYWRLTAGE